MQIQWKLRLKELQREYLKAVGNFLHNLRKLYINEMVIQKFSAFLK